MAVALGVSSGFVEVAPTEDPGGSTITIDRYAYVTGDTSPATAAKITEVGWWCNTATEEANFEIGLYAADGAVVPGEAGTLLEVERTNAKGTGTGWKRVTVDWDIDSDTNYWIGVQLDDTASTTQTDYTETGIGIDRISNPPDLPSPFGGGSYILTPGIMAFYALWEAVGGVEHTHFATDTLAMTDSMTPAMTFNVALADTHAIGDSLAALKVLLHSTGDTLAISDSLAAPAMQFNVALADTLNMNDALSSAVMEFNVALADTLEISDSLEAAATYAVSLADTLEISDSLAYVLIVAEIRRRAGIVRKIGMPTAQNIGLGM